jgi:hypothetical protein
MVMLKQIEHVCPFALPVRLQHSDKILQVYVYKNAVTLINMGTHIMRKGIVCLSAHQIFKDSLIS